MVVPILLFLILAGLLGVWHHGLCSGRSLICAEHGGRDGNAGKKPGLDLLPLGFRGLPLCISSLMSWPSHFGLQPEQLDPPSAVPQRSHSLAFPTGLCTTL